MIRKRKLGWQLVLIAFLLPCGCSFTKSVKQSLVEKFHDAPESKEIPIHSSMFPSCAVTVGEKGMSLADCLRDSKALKYLENRKKLLEKSSTSQIPLTNHELESINTVLESSSSKNLSLDSLDSLAAETNNLFLKNPTLNIPKGWAQGFPHYILEPTEISVNDERNFLHAIDTIDDPYLKQKTKEDIDRFFHPKTSDKAKKEILENISVMASDGIIKVSRPQQIKSWCFVILNHSISAKQKQSEEDSQSKQNDQKGEKEKSEKDDAASGVIVSGTKPKTQTEKTQTSRSPIITPDHFLNERANPTEETNRQTSPNAKRLNSASRSRSATSSETMMIVIQEYNGEVTILPLDLVFQSPIGDLSVFHGDRINIVPFSELPFANKVGGQKKVGILGMAAKKGVVDSQAVSLWSFLLQQRANMDYRVDLVSVTTTNPNNSVNAILPFDMKTLPEATQAKLQALVKNWGLENGAVVSFQMSGLHETFLKRQPPSSDKRCLIQKRRSAKSSFFE